ncbi:carboxypeptidase-like regulatory domain-containing protein [Hymenobacter sp. ISL-91]|uniref:TonB-dependent receptor n=1 Tax=Hymenobacter sp. ISL-91 TaxID=2819151 RepID=UPI001BE79E17|nr:TonB-dependent receptor [Hymenobacter sp. ISL-91]MBT2556160.1 carboxypeptidase-like regulatory domain-containing protein [Hymenobacter sp. ISL-91]
MQRTLTLFFLLLLLLLTSSLARAQQATLSGTIRDKKTGEGAIGATVIITGTTQAAPVELDGTYRLMAAPGTYTISVQSIGYKSLTFPGIVLREGQTTTLNGGLEESTQTLGEVVVTGQKQTGTEVALLQDLKKSEVVVSGMSSDQIVKTLDRDAAEVVKRIPGVTIQNNSFIVIRGLAERYNTVLLNDALTPSSEVDTRSFSFDILPSSVIDRVLIFKSGAPELPGEFGGGAVKVYTKNSVLENTTSLSVSAWHRSGTTFKSGYQQSPQRSGTQWAGYDGGERKMPTTIGTEPYDSQNPLTDAQLLQAARALDNNWKPRLSTALPDLRASLGLTRKYALGRAQLSNVTSVSYSNTHQQYQVQRQRLETGTGNYIYNYSDEQAQTASRLGVIHNWQVRLSDNHRLELRNFLNQYGTDEVTHRTGLDYAQGGDGRARDNYALHYQSRTIYSGQLAGTHELGAAKNSTLTWQSGYNYVLRNEPDYRRYRTGSDVPLPGDPAPPFQVEISQIGSQQDVSSYYSRLREDTYMGSGQWEQRLSGRDTTRESQYKLRAGFYTEYKERNYASRFFSFVPARPGRFNYDLLQLPIETIFSPENIDPNTGFTLREGTGDEDSYRADNLLAAGYLSAVAPVSDKVSVSGGVRMEYNRKFLRSGLGSAAPYEEQRTFFLPSINSTYNFNLRSLLRLAGSVTLNRPEFREVAGYAYYDFNNNALIKGNRDLRTAKIYNADLRYEFYPTKAELLSVGVFYKKFNDAIEQVTGSTTGSALELGFVNARSAYDVGVEVEARKGLADITDNRFLQHFAFVLNASLIKSRVTLSDDEQLAGNLNERALQGQSPYVVNTGIFYQDDARGWQVSAQYNVIGPRILFASSNTQNFTIFELSRHVIDLAATKRVGEHLSVRVGIQDALNQHTRQYYDSNRDGKITGADGGAFARFRRGQYSTVGLTYQF